MSNPLATLCNALLDYLEGGRLTWILSGTCCLRARRVKYRRAPSNRSTRLFNILTAHVQNMIHFLCRALSSAKAKYARSGLLRVPSRQTATAQYLAIAIPSRKVQRAKIVHWNIKTKWLDLIFALFVFFFEKKPRAVFPRVSLRKMKFDTSLPR